MRQRDATYTLSGDNVGGALLTSLHARTSNGDPFIRTVSSRLLKTLSVPFFATLASWIYQGELRDPFGEFFVALNPALGDRPIDGGASPNNFGSWSGNGAAGDYSSAAGPGASLGSGVGGTGMGGFGDEYDDGTQTGRVQAHELWEGKFTFRREMLPGFLEESFGRKVSKASPRQLLSSKFLVEREADAFVPDRVASSCPALGRSSRLANRSTL